MPFELPSSLGPLLSLFRPCFTRPGFQTFCALTVGMLTRVRARTVTGMLAAAGLAGHWHHSRAHRFFSRARWSTDRLGLVVLQLVASRLVPADEPLCVALDDTLLKRCGPKVFGRLLNYDGSSQAAGPKHQRIAWGNSWVVAGAVVELPFLARAICLPVLFRLWRPGQGPTQVELGADLVRVAARAHPERRLIVLADGSYAGGALAPANVPPNVTLVVRARRDIRIHRPPPPRRRGQMGRPACGASCDPPCGSWPPPARRSGSGRRSSSTGKPQRSSSQASAGCGGRRGVMRPRRRCATLARPIRSTWC